MLANLVVFLRSDISKIPAQQDKVTRLLKFSAGNLQAAQQLPRGRSSESLGDICRRRGAGAPHLRHNPILFSPRKTPCQFVDFERELMRFLPNRKVFERLDLHSSLLPHASPVTSHWSPVTVLPRRRRSADHLDDLARNRGLTYFVHVQSQGVDHVGGVAGG